MGLHTLLLKLYLLAGIRLLNKSPLLNYNGLLHNFILSGILILMLFFLPTSGQQIRLRPNVGTNLSFSHGTPSSIDKNSSLSVLPRFGYCYGVQLDIRTDNFSKVHFTSGVNKTETGINYKVKYYGDIENWQHKSASNIKSLNIPILGNVTVKKIKYNISWGAGTILNFYTPIGPPLATKVAVYSADTIFASKANIMYNSKAFGLVFRIAFEKQLRSNWFIIYCDYVHGTKQIWGSTINYSINQKIFVRENVITKSSYIALNICYGFGWKKPPEFSDKIYN